MNQSVHPLVPTFPKALQDRLSHLAPAVRVSVEDVLHRALRADGTPIYGSRFDAIGKVGRNWYGIHDEDALFALVAAVGLTWSLTKLMKEGDPKPDALLLGAITLYLKVRKVVKLTKEQAVVLLTLKASDLGDGAAPPEIVAALPDEVPLSGEQVEQVLNELSRLRFGDNKPAQFVSCTDGRWQALDV